MSSDPSSSRNTRKHGAEQLAENEDLSSLPAHIKAVRDGLLDFDKVLGLQAAMLISGERTQILFRCQHIKPKARPNRSGPERRNS
jgi:hypothetical protein